MKLGRSLTNPIRSEVKEGGGGSGSTNLSYTASPTNGIVTSDTGDDATIPAADETNAGLILPAEKTIVNNSVPVQIAYTTSIPFDKLLTDIADHTMAGDVTFTINTVGAIDNGGAQIKLINNAAYNINLAAFHVGGVYDNTTLQSILTFIRKRGEYYVTIVNFTA